MHFYPRSPCGERPRSILPHKKKRGISIHALLAESDLPAALPSKSATGFLSTLSLRRATRASSALSLCSVNFYPRSPCGERRRICTLTTGAVYFYPRSPCGERHDALGRAGFQGVISIHALLAESDNFLCYTKCNETHFYPRSPCGERQLSGQEQQQITAISIHALLAESDTSSSTSGCRLSVFLSTLSLRRATAQGSVGIPGVSHFYPRSPCGERLTVFCRKHRANCIISIHALLAESDRWCLVAPRQMTEFLSTLSLRRATAKVHKTVGHFCAYGTNFMGIASSC